MDKRAIGLRMELLSSRPKIKAAIADYVQRVATDYADEVLSITLYGSQARREASAESDIDLFIVVRHDTPALREALADLAWRVQFEHDVVISDVIRTDDQLRHMQARQFPYYQNIKREGILLWKNPSAPMPIYV
jgi:predicted nucleotidyltransferase